MFKKLEKQVKEYLAKIKLEERQKKYAELLKAGGLFIQWVEKDIADSEKHGRSERRRFEHSLNDKGRFSKEMFDYYFTKLENVLAYIDKYREMEKQAKRKAKQPPVVKKECSGNCKCEKKEANA